MSSSLTSSNKSWDGSDPASLVAVKRPVSWGWHPPGGPTSAPNAHHDSRLRGASDPHAVPLDRNIQPLRSCLSEARRARASYDTWLSCSCHSRCRNWSLMRPRSSTSTSDILGHEVTRSYLAYVPHTHMSQTFFCRLAMTNICRLRVDASVIKTFASTSSSGRRSQKFS